MDEIAIYIIVAALGFGLGLVFGATAQRTNFCTMGSISDIVFMGNWNRFRAWMLAIAIAVIGAQALHLTGAIDLNQSVYLSTNFGWAGAIIGGLLFGFGMTMTGGCAAKTLVRLGAGNLKSLVVALVLGVVAYMTMRGLFGVARMEFEGVVNTDLSGAGLAAQGVPDILSASVGLSLNAARALAATLFAGALLVFCFRSAAFRASGRDLAAGLILGLVIVGGWIATGIVGNDPFEPTQLASLTFVAPVADSIMYLMTFTGATITFGIATVGGVIVGAFLMAVARQEFRIESFNDANDMMRHITGASMMGVGGVMAVGCTIGQGMTGISTLSLGSGLALLSIIFGAVLGFKYLEEGTLGGAVRALFARA